MKRVEIIQEARDWKGSKWQHQASLKGVACDCVGLVRGVHYQLTGIIIPVPVDYPATWHLFKSDPWLYDECKVHAGPEVSIEYALPGDILLFSVRDRFVAHHCGILTADSTFIHSYMDVEKVVETRIEARVKNEAKTWRECIKAVFHFPGVSD